MPSKAVVTKGKSSLPKGKLVLATKKSAKEVPPSKTLPKKVVAVVKEEDGPFVGEYQRVKECATCDCFELDTEAEDGGDAGFFARKGEPQRIYLKHAILRATRVKITVEVLEEPDDE